MHTEWNLAILEITHQILHELQRPLTGWLYQDPIYDLTLLGFEHELVDDTEQTK